VPDARLFICPSHGLYAVVSDKRLEIGGFTQPGPLRVQGVLADELAGDLGAGRLSAANRSRLHSLAGATGAPAQAAIEALDRGAFRLAVPTDLVRRGGYRMLWVELVGGCNLQCVHCYAQSDPSRSEMLDLETTAGILSDAAELGFSTVQFTGGEPLLHPALLKAVDAARQHELQVEVFTNGLLLEQPLLEALLRRQARFALSLYADTSEMHDRVTGVAGSWHQTVDAIGRAAQAGAKVRVAVLAMPFNQDRLMPTLRFAADLVGDPAAVGLDVVRNVGRGRYDQNVVIPPEAWQWAQRGIDPAAGRPAASGRACVSASGEVYPCIFTRWVTLGRIGKDKTLREILEAPTTRPGWSLAPEPELEAACRARLTCVECQRAARLLALYANHATETT
jgi:MoaA/NifB/PqqE/SkfB family radical SAM enzyme